MKSMRDAGAYNLVQDEATYPNGTHVCELEVDPETGAVEIVSPADGKIIAPDDLAQECFCQDTLVASLKTHQSLPCPLPPGACGHV